jgi:hypothetical protein
MQTVKFMCWKKEEMHIAHFLDYPDYWTQGTNLDDLTDHLRHLYGDIIRLRLG